MTIFRYLLVLCCGLALVAALVAQPKEPIDPDHAAKMTRGLEIFKQHVKPLLVKNCLRCHGGQTVESGFDLSDRPLLLKGGDAGPAVIAGNAKDSYLFKLVTHAREPRMPHKKGKLPDEVLTHIAAWIDNGAPYDAPLIEKKKGPSWTETKVPTDAREFWSFQPLRRVDPPAVKNESACRTPIDRFIFARQQAAGIEANAPISRRQLIRRAYFDVIGLPPSPQELEAALNDPAPDWFEKLVDKLLASPHYGERWGRHWLDLARWAESHGFEHDYDRPSAYHYRDFVIKALNDDLPYDTFVKWQLAGDEYEPNNNLALAASGFLAAGVHSTQITKKEVEKHRYDEMDDMVQTTSTALLGLTIGCARCHDHKFDPIPQRDYYRMLATFTTTVRSEVEMNLDPAGYARAKAAFDKEHEPFAAALKKFEEEQLPARLAAWEKAGGLGDRVPWVILEPTGTKGEEGTTFTKREDGSFLVAGKNAVLESYGFTAQTKLTGITAIRLETLRDPALPKGGPGRAPNGNFALSDFRVTATAKMPDAKPVKLKLHNPRATFEQKGFPVKNAIDDNEKSAWAVDPEFGKDHAAVFEIEGDVGTAPGTTLSFVLSFRHSAGHGIGRPRLSVTTAKGPVDLQANGIPESVLPILQVAAEQRSPEQTTALLKWYRTIDPDWRKLQQAAQDHLMKAPRPNLVKAMISTEGLPAIRLHTQGDDFLKETHFLKRGDPEQKEGVATSSFLQVLMPAADAEKRWQTAPPAGWRTSYRRRALAEWLTDVDNGAGRLLARVIVNRLWQHHMGRGIVATPSDFGHRGDKPTDPELLDWLATELIRNGWRLKAIHRLILTSACYQESSQRDDAKIKADPENRLFWRRQPRRLEAEAIRDALLAVSGELDNKMFGAGTLDPASKRRSIYFTVKRSKLIPMMSVFDAPDALGGLGERPTTTIAPQALLLMNNPQVRSWAKSMARRIAPDAKTPLEDAVKAGYVLALSRPPTAEEQKESVAFIREQMESYKATGKGDGRDAALTALCQVLMCLNEFVYVD
jgi:mono/diheme cytochrome c family protein